MGWKKGKVHCPGCGKGMECNEPHLYVGETPDTLKYICGYSCNDWRCGWTAPNGSGKTREEALQNAKERALVRTSHMSDIVDLEIRLEAALRDLKEADALDCKHCKHTGAMCEQADYICKNCISDCICRTCRNNDKWEWRGPQEEVSPDD